MLSGKSLLTNSSIDDILISCLIVVELWTRSMSGVNMWVKYITCHSSINDLLLTIDLVV